MNLSAVDLNLLLVLHEMLEDPSVSRAAKRLSVTSPAVSNALKRLRQLFDDPLFVRSGRGVVPTPRALELAPSVARAVAELESMLAEQPRDPSATTRAVTIALDDMNQVVRLPKLVALFRTRMPLASLDIISIDTLVARGGLEAGAADATIAPKQAAAGYLSAPLFIERGVLVVRKGHPFLRRRDKAAAFGDLRHVDIHIALGQGGAGHKLAEDEIARAGFARNIAVTVPTFAAAAMIAASSDLVAGLPLGLVETLQRTAPLVRLDGPSGAGMEMEMHLVWHERTHHDPVCAFFRELTSEALRDESFSTPLA